MAGLLNKFTVTKNLKPTDLLKKIFFEIMYFAIS